MKKTDIAKLPEYFDRYINLVDDIEIIEALEQYGMPIIQKEFKRWEKLGDQVYAPGKWTVKDILQHVIDTERIFCYRALRFARNDSTILPGYDENEYAAQAQTENRTLEDLFEEFEAVRNSTIQLYKSFSEDMLQKEGICFDKNISVLAIGFTIVGHLIHHRDVISERYYPLMY